MGIHASKTHHSIPSIITEVSEECLRCTGKGSSDPGNPGSFQELHKKVKDLYPKNFEGMTLTINKKLCNHFRVSHTLTLSSVTPSGYKFGACYEGSTMIGTTERYPSLASTIMPNGNQTMTFMHTLGCRYRVKFGAQIADGKYKACNSVLEYRSDNCTLSLSLDNPSLLDQNGAFALHFLQSVSSRLALGAEIACLRDETVDAQAILSGAARYSTGRFTVSSTLSRAGFHICCHRKASEQLQLGAEMEINFITEESLGSLVYRLDVPQGNFILSGMINNEGTVSSVFEKKLSTAYESSLLISGIFNGQKDQFRVGVGLKVG